MRLHRSILMFLLGLPFMLCSVVFGQTGDNNKVLSNASLQEVIHYALINKPGVKQALIDEEIGERDIKSALSGWLPQINGSANYNYNLKQQQSTLTFNGETSLLIVGTKYTSAMTLQADQKFLDAGLIQASKASKYYRLQYKESTESAKISTVVEVSKAYFDILTSKEQLNIINENIARLEKQFKDSHAQYDVGLVDKTDYQRAQISLSNSKADRKRAEELMKYKYAYLKQLIGYSSDKDISLNFDTMRMENEVLLDTNQARNYENRVEYRLLQTQKKLQQLNTSYNKWAYLPTIAGFINYNWNYQNNNFKDLYNTNYPSSLFGLTLNLPIFQGTKRTQEIRKSELQEKRIDLDLYNTRNQINAQYEQAIATYKANLNDWKTTFANVELSKQVYNIIKQQYDEGIKTYLDLMTAETDLRTTQLNYLNSLYSLLSSKLDVQQALGTIIVNQ
ncbi:MAG: TolC family protein [Candidatus Pedobacter colombiensis]|uniref:TolC family protein n=1 Tax=Candidatus Pedobacter colombiensis TaxID=3121371 RepID=A0AAJ6B673_9SPHI|nr:TolC family protein [Pedobacter sp.]WEK18930.1 MAG: TolC family protein [Pedobacter sp.]